MYIHQALHGYKQGHNKLASSIALPTIDEDRMKILSDWSEYAGSIDGDMSYITVYPLTQYNLFVIAKTWYADEMDRPGCVWTHSLIIDLTDIDDTFDFRLLNSLFHRPSSKEKYLYDQKIELTASCSQVIDHAISIPLEDICVLYNILIKNCTMVFSVENTSDYYQFLILSILQYLPIGMIKTLRVCTGASSIRKDASIDFNLTFTPMSGYSLSSMELEDKIMKNNVGIRHLCNSIYHNDKDVYQLIRFFSNDVGNDSNKLNTLGELLKALSEAYKAKSNISYNDIVDTIIHAFPNKNEGASLKRLFLGTKVGMLFTTEENYYVKICELSDNIFDDWQSLNIDSATSQYMSSSPKNFISLLERLVSLDRMNDIGKKVLDNAAHIATIPLLKQLSESHWSIFMALVSINSDLLINEFWLSLPTTKVSSLFSVIETLDSESIVYWDKILKYLLENSLDTSFSFINKIHSNCSNSIALVMEYLQTQENRILPKSIIDLCSLHRKEIILWMETKQTVSVNAIQFIMEVISPVSKEVKELGVEPWIPLSNADMQDSKLGYNLYLLRLSLNWKSPIALDILKSSFYTIYIAMSKDKLSFSEFNILNPYMDDVPFWQSWDNCKKFRKGIVRTLKNIGYSRNDLIDLTPSPELNSTLIKIWDKTK